MRVGMGREHQKTIYAKFFHLSHTFSSAGKVAEVLLSLDESGRTRLSCICPWIL